MLIWCDTQIFNLDFFILAIHLSFKPVLRIRDILVRIWIRIRGSVPMTTGSGSGSSYFRHWPSSAYYFLKVHLHHFSKIKSPKTLKTLEINVFLTIFSWWSKDPNPDPYLWLMDTDPGGPKNTDPDPQNCFNRLWPSALARNSVLHTWIYQFCTYHTFIRHVGASRFTYF